MARIIGIDYGEKRVGLAVTDVLQITANGLETVENAQIFEFLKNYLSKENVEKFVIGSPKTLRNEPAKVMAEIDNFATRLRTEFPDVAVEFVDERFTSVLAQKAMISAGAKKKTRQNKALVDKISATIILQFYLENRKLKI